MARMMQHLPAWFTALVVAGVVAGTTWLITPLQYSSPVTHDAWSLELNERVALWHPVETMPAPRPFPRGITRAAPIEPVVSRAEPLIVLPRAKPRPVDRSLLARAQAHVGTNPTGWATLWCARFMCIVMPEVCSKVPHPNLARSWEVLPKVAKPAPNVIAILSRGKNPKAGHIGIIVKVKRKSIIVLSGNTTWNGKRRTVGYNEYPMSRVVALVRPS